MQRFSYLINSRGTEGNRTAVSSGVSSSGSLDAQSVQSSSFIQAGIQPQSMQLGKRTQMNSRTANNSINEIDSLMREDNSEIIQNNSTNKRLSNPALPVSVPAVSMSRQQMASIKQSARKVKDIQVAESNSKQSNSIKEYLDSGLEYPYQRLCEVLQSPGQIGYQKQKIDYMVMVANSIGVSFFDVLNLLPSKVLATLFNDFKSQENMFINILLYSSCGLSSLNKVFEDIFVDLGDQTDFINDYMTAHVSSGIQADQNHNNYNGFLSNYSRNHLEECSEEIAPANRMRIFFSKYIIPYVLHQLINFNSDLQTSFYAALGPGEEGMSQFLSSQQCSQNQSNSFLNMPYFSQSLRIFMEKVYRKYPSKGATVLQALQQICKMECETAFDATLFSYDDLKQDRIVLYRMAMSGTKQLLYAYLQNKNVLSSYASKELFNFKKKDVFISYYKSFITSTSADSEDTIFRISANLENYCKALVMSQNKANALRNSIALIRLLTPFVTEQFLQKKNFVKASCWRITRFILFIHDGSLAIVALSFLMHCFDNLFDEGALLFSDRERFTHMLIAFLFLNRNRADDPVFNDSMDVAARLIERLVSHSTCNKYQYWILNYNSNSFDVTIDLSFWFF